MTLLAFEAALRLPVQHVTILTLTSYHDTSLAVDAFSACRHNQFPAKAVELLEQGWAVSWKLSRLRVWPRSFARLSVHLCRPA